MPPNILFGKSAFILIAQKINTFLINFYEDVFYYIAVYIHLFYFINFLPNLRLKILLTNIKIQSHD